MKIDIYYSLKARNHGTHIQINDSVEEFKFEISEWVRMSQLAFCQFMVMNKTIRLYFTRRLTAFEKWLVPLKVAAPTISNTIESKTYIFQIQSIIFNNC